MKKLLLLLAFTSNAYATNYGNPLQPSATSNANAESVAQAASGSESVATAQGGSVGGIRFEDKLQIPNSPGLSSGSSNTTANDYKYKQRQVSTILGGVTNIDMELDIIGFLKFYGTITDAETKATFNMAACIESEKWRILRKQQGLPCLP